MSGDNKHFLVKSKAWLPNIDIRPIYQRKGYPNQETYELSPFHQEKNLDDYVNQWEWEAAHKLYQKSVWAKWYYGKDPADGPAFANVNHRNDM